VTHPTDRSPYIFVSYARPDLDYVSRLAAHLQTRGLQVWFDQQTPTGSRWQREIASKLEHAAAVVLVGSPESENSFWVAEEITHARRFEIPILPILIQGDTWFGIYTLEAHVVTGGAMPSEVFVALLHKLCVSGSTSGIVTTDVAASAPKGLSDSEFVRPLAVGHRVLVESIVVDDGGLDCVDWSPDGRHLVTVGPSRKVRLLDPAFGESQWSLGRLTSRPGALRWAPDGGAIAAVSVDGSLGVWEAEPRTRAWRMTTYNRTRITQWWLTWSAESKRIVVGPQLGSPLIVDARTGELLHIMEKGACPVLWSPDGRHIATARRNGGLRLWHGEDYSRGPRAPRLGKDEFLKSMTWSSDGMHLGALDMNGDIFVIRSDGWEVLSRIKVGPLAASIAFSHNAAFLWTATAFGLKLWNAIDGALMHVWEDFGIETPALMVNVLAISPDSSYVALGCRDGRLRFVPTHHLGLA
jgi:WD40 repeat protein